MKKQFNFEYVRDYLSSVLKNKMEKRKKFYGKRRWKPIRGSNTDTEPLWNKYELAALYRAMRKLCKDFSRNITFTFEDVVKCDRYRMGYTDWVRGLIYDLCELLGLVNKD